MAASWAGEERSWLVGVGRRFFCFLSLFLLCSKEM